MKLNASIAATEAGDGMLGFSHGISARAHRAFCPSEEVIGSLTVYCGVICPSMADRAAVDDAGLAEIPAQTFRNIVCDHEANMLAGAYCQAVRISDLRKSSMELLRQHLAYMSAMSWSSSRISSSSCTQDSMSQYTHHHNCTLRPNLAEPLPSPA